MTIKKILGIMLCCMLAAALLSPCVPAAGNIDITKTADLTIDFIHQGTPIGGAQFDLYMASSVSAYFDHELDGDFKGYAAELEGLDTAGWDTLATTLASYALYSGLKPVRQGFTNDNGRLVFEDLEPGLYLAIGHSKVIGDTKYTVKPFLVFLPGLDAEANKWIYEVTVKPKSDSEKVYEDTVSRKVIKIWDDDGYESERPLSITVYLLRDGVIADTVTLNKENNWSYTWTDLDGKSSWTVAEKETEYTTTIRQDGITFIITNKHYIPIHNPPYDPPPYDPPSDDPPSDDPPSDDPPSDDPPSDNPPSDDPPSDEPPIDIPDDPVPLDPLPQTGLLWWPVLILVPAGSFMLLAGFILRKREKNEQKE